VIYNAVLALAVLIILARGVLVARERWVWLPLGAGLGLWASANTYYSIFLADLDPVPIPSVADALWLAFYPTVYVAMVLIVRSRLSGLRRGMWLDGIIGALAVAALCAAVVLAPFLAGLSGSMAEIATNLAYPLGDLILLSMTTLLMTSAASARRVLGLAVFDLNGFKTYNDRFGHPAGMRCSSGSAIASRQRSAATAWRTGWAATSSAPFCARRTPRSRRSRAALSPR
jgi:hypothetical protein